MKDQYQHVSYLWDTAQAPSDELGQLIYRSNLLGQDPRITNTGGGNTSAKIFETDPLTGQQVEVLWVKGSGGDLRTSKKENFASLYMDKLQALRPMYLSDPKRGLKTEIEDRQVANYAHCAFNLNPRASSIDTPLHAYLPAKHIDHTHPVAVIAIAASSKSRELTREIFGDEVGWVPWMRPGFELGLLMQKTIEQNPNLKGLVMGQHGLINWGNSSKECYETTLRLIEKAATFIATRSYDFGGAKHPPLAASQREELLVEILPWLRGKLSQRSRLVATVQQDDAILQFVNSNEAPRLAELGTSCPDHFLRTKIKPLYVDWNPQNSDATSLKKALDEGLNRYRADYASYYQRCRKPASPAMRDPSPTVILIPGVGMIAWGKNKNEANITAEFYGGAVQVMRGAEAIDQYIALPQQEAFDIEYWELEEAKLRRMPAEKELERRIAVVIGAAAGIGKAVADHLSKECPHVVRADLSADARIAVNVTDRSSLRNLYRKIVLEFGGLDHIVVTAGVFQGDWDKIFQINVRGSHDAVDEAKSIFQSQNLADCSVVLTSSVNAAVSKKGSIGYDASKAALNHVVRELAIELAPLVRVNAIAPATVVAGSTMFPRDRVMESLRKYAIAFDEVESTEQLRDKLSNFYAKRNLLGVPITPTDQAKAVYFLLSGASSRTTGQIINVDGGLHEAFLR